MNMYQVHTTRTSTILVFHTGITRNHIKYVLLRIGYSLPSFHFCRRPSIDCGLVWCQKGSVQAESISNLHL